MGKFIKPGKAVLVQARHYTRFYSGCKPIIMKNVDDDTSECPFSCSLVAEIDHYPSKVTASHGQEERPEVKDQGFVKVYNYTSCPQGALWLSP
ncbi:hypothetical protein P7K49_037533 [Saguinus oedipus]|uniref:Uncharacterized protein n=1 Tax=Saguinus oedipus TaxID=9490 RepID=A0ABQ9TIA8_SAGOE|nr:hypothetical protein P7K49_037533 [Saguinus oedipus]